MPVLLRHYLSLNGKMVCFNIHADFNDSLEGLIIVDARNTHPKTLLVLWVWRDIMYLMRCTSCLNQLKFKILIP